MLKVYILLTFLLSIIFLPFTGFSQQPNGTIKGRVLTSDARPASWVSVQLKDASKTVLTNEEGFFTLKNIPVGPQEITVSLIGYKNAMRSITVEANTTARLDIHLDVSDMQLQEVIVQGNKKRYNDRQLSPSLRLNEPLLEVPQNIQIVSAAMLADQQVTSMSDGAIRNVSGAIRLEHWGDMYTRINARGSQIQAFRNGFNVVSSSWGPLTEDMSFVDHIEFVKGPAGFMLANGDPSGLYNVVTKKPTGQTKGEVSFTLGSFDMYRSTLDLDGKLSKDGRLLYRLNLSGQDKKSFRPNEFNNRYSIAPVISYQVDDKTKVTLEYTVQHAKMSDVGSYYSFSTKGYGVLPRNFTTLPAGLDPTVMDDQSITANLQHEISDNWKITAQAAYYSYKQQGSSLWPESVNEDGTMIRSVGNWDAKSEMTFGQFFLNGKVQTGAITHRILAGIDLGTKNYMADWNQYHSLDTVGAEFNTNDPYYGAPVNGYPVFDRSASLTERATLGGGLIDQRYSGVYVQDELGFFNNTLRLTLAGRYTDVSQSSYGGEPEKAKRFTPRVGLSFSVDRSTSLYALYDQAFIPQAGKLASGGKIQPVTGNNMEFGIKKDWAGGKWSSTASVYRILKNNELTGDPDSAPNSGLSVVMGQKRAQGVEVDLKGNIISGLNLVANYAYTDAVITKVTPGVPDIKKGDIVPGYAKHTVNSWLSYSLQKGALKGTGISGGFTYLLDRASNTFSSTAPEQNLPDYFKLDAGAFWGKDKIKITFNVFNLLNKYLYSGSYESWMGNVYSWQVEAPRNLRLSVAYTF
jgi:iron complex outermembrane receptor protein